MYLMGNSMLISAPSWICICTFECLPWGQELSHHTAFCHRQEAGRRALESNAAEQLEMEKPLIINYSHRFHAEINFAQCQFYGAIDHT